MISGWEIFHFSGSSPGRRPDACKSVPIPPSRYKILSFKFFPTTNPITTEIIKTIIVNIISKPGDVVLVTGPNYGLFTIRAEREGAEVEVLPLSKEDNWLVNPKKLAQKIDEINKA